LRYGVIVEKKAESNLAAAAAAATVAAAAAVIVLQLSFVSEYSTKGFCWKNFTVIVSRLNKNYTQ